MAAVGVSMLVLTREVRYHLHFVACSRPTPPSKYIGVNLGIEHINASSSPLQCSLFAASGGIATFQEILSES